MEEDSYPHFIKRERGGEWEPCRACRNLTPSLTKGFARGRFETKFYRVGRLVGLPKACAFGTGQFG